MKAHLLVAGLAGLAAIHSSEAIEFEGTVGGSALSGDGIRYLNFNDPLNLGIEGPNGVDVSFTGHAKAVKEYGNYYAPAHISGNNHDHFDTVENDGPSKSGYLQSSKGSNGISAANPAGSRIYFDFDEKQNYFGLLWGSMDPYNFIAFYLNGTAVLFNGMDNVSGSDVNAHANGSQDEVGTQYVNFTGLEFNEVIIWSDNYSFEFDNVAYGKIAANGVPDGGMTAALLGLSMTGMAMIRRKFQS